MTIEKLEEFASNGDKHLTGLDVATGFPRADKPERPWFNKLFGDITGKINEIVDNIDELPPFEGGILADTFLTVTQNGLGTIARTQRAKNKDIVTPYDFGAIGNLDFNKLSTKYSSLIEAQKDYPLATSLDDEIDWCALQAFFNYCKNNIVVNANFGGSFFINKPLQYINGHRAKTKVFSGEMFLVATTSMPYVCRIAGSFLRLDSVSIDKVDSNVLYDYGLYIGGYEGSSSSINTSVGTIHAIGADIASVNVNQNTMFCNFGTVRGTGGKTGDITFSNATSLSTDIYGQRSRLTLPSMPFYSSTNTLNPADFLNPQQYLIIDDKPYKIMERDVVANTVDVFPLYLGSDSGTAKFVSGAFFHHGGNNAGCITVDSLSAVNGAVGLSETALYTGTYKSLNVEFCAVGLSVGIGLGNPAMTLDIIRAYFEGNTLDYVQNASFEAQQTLNLANCVNINPSKCFGITINDGVVDYIDNLSASGVLENTRLSIGNTVYTTRKDPFVAGYIATKSIELCGDMGVRQYAYGIGGSVFNFSVDSDKLRLVGHSSLTLVLKNRDGGDKYNSNTVTLNAPSGWKFDSEGSTQLVLDGFSGAAVIYINAVKLNDGNFILVSTNKIVAPVNKGVTASRPSNPVLGQLYYDTTLLASGKPITWNGSEWVDALGVVV